MATYYLDLNVSASSDDGITNSTPMNLSDFIAMSKVSGDIFYVKGSREEVILSNYTVYTDYNNPVTWKQWLGLNEPWRFYIHGSASDLNTYLNGIKLEGGILKITLSAPSSKIYLNSSIINCIVDVFPGGSSTVLSLEGSDKLIKGSIFKHTGSGTGGLTTQSIEFEDCIVLLYHISSPGAMNVTFTNCAFNLNNGGIFFTVTSADSHLLTSFPTIPDWDADESDWSYYSLFSEIPTPPQPGNSPYTGYETDLWGNQRLGIGNGFFGTIITIQNCQFDWTPPSDYPFTPNNDLYDKNIAYIIANRKKLKPFSGIASPPNPGKNYSTYPNYETGLFGFLRKDYVLSGTA
jgi:hypothetical protein